jgi:hypothetical protein
MNQSKPNPIQPHFGQANQPQLEPALETLAPRITEPLLARKGRLYLLCDPTVDESITSGIYQTYYFTAAFDPMRCLQLALKHICSSASAPSLMAGALVYNMTLYAAGTLHAGVWLWRNKHVIQVLPNPKGFAVGIPGSSKSPDPDQYHCQEAQCRLYPGDTIILGNTLGGRKLNARLLGQVEAFSTTTEALARAIAQLTRSAAEPHPPITIVRLPGTPSTPQLPPQSQIDFAYAGAAEVAPKSKRSPVLYAAIIAFIAIVLAVIVTKPRLPTDFLRNWFLSNPLITQTLWPSPGGTGTPSPTLTPTPSSTSTPAN